MRLVKRGFQGAEGFSSVGRSCWMPGLRWSCVGVSEAAQHRVRLVGEVSSQPGEVLLPKNK